jgi:hypothetical protein
LDSRRHGGCQQVNNVLQILVHEKLDSKPDDVIGHGEIPVRDVELGHSVFRSTELLKVKDKGEIDGKSRPGSTGALTVQVNVQWGNKAGFNESPWSFPFHDASIKFLKAANAGRSSDGSHRYQSCSKSELTKHDEEDSEIVDCPVLERREAFLSWQS